MTQWCLVVKENGEWVEADDAGYDNRFDSEEGAAQEIEWLHGLGPIYESLDYKVCLVDEIDKLNEPLTGH